MTTDVGKPRASGDLDELYKPRGPVSEALSSYYVQHVVQSAIDGAFRLAPVSALPASQKTSQ